MDLGPVWYVRAAHDGGKGHARRRCSGGGCAALDVVTLTTHHLHQGLGPVPDGQSPPLESFPAPFEGGSLPLLVVGKLPSVRLSCFLTCRAHVVA